jgi:hypothetical protein
LGAPTTNHEQTSTGICSSAGGSLTSPWPPTSLLRPAYCGGSHQRSGWLGSVEATPKLHSRPVMHQQPLLSCGLSCVTLWCRDNVIGVVLHTHSCHDLKQCQGLFDTIMATPLHCCADIVVGLTCAQEYTCSSGTAWPSPRRVNLSADTPMEVGGHDGVSVSTHNVQALHASSDMHVLVLLKSYVLMCG